MTSRTSRKINLGGLAIGGGSPVLVQSMTNTDTADVEATLAQIESLASLGCQACRIAVPSESALQAVPSIVAAARMPIIADIHFDWRLAIGSIEAGVAGLRINPGNIGQEDRVNAVIDAAKSAGAALRIGVNSGSLQKELLLKHGRPTPAALAESALLYVRILEKRRFDNFKFSLKSSSVTDTVAAYRLFAEQCDCPLHIGITEAGFGMAGIVKSAVGLGILLNEGLGDTIRVSLTGPPQEEVRVAWQILASLGLATPGPEIISCPTCGRTEIDLLKLVQAVEKALANCTAPIKVAVMGCVVNGPGEAREADIGLAGGRNRGVIFKKGRLIRSVAGQDALLAAFLDELNALVNNYSN